MKTVTRIDKPTLKALEAQILEDLRELEKEAGVTFCFSGGRFGETAATLKLEVAVVAAVKSVLAQMGGK